MKITRLWYRPVWLLKEIKIRSTYSFILISHCESHRLIVFLRLVQVAFHSWCRHVPSSLVMSFPLISHLLLIYIHCSKEILISSWHARLCRVALIHCIYPTISARYPPILRSNSPAMFTKPKSSYALYYRALHHSIIPPERLLPTLWLGVGMSLLLEGCWLIERLRLRVLMVLIDSLLRTAT